MAKNKKNSNVTAGTREGTSTKKPLVSVKSRKTQSTATAILNNKKELAFGKENYKWVAIGVAMITVGMLLMMGGYNENPAVWDDSQIYGFRRTLLAPVVILAGLGVEIYAIFK